MKRLLVLAVAAVALVVTGCSCGPGFLHCESPCYGKSLQRNGRQIMDFVDVHFLNYDRHDPYRCDPCIGN